MIQTVIVASSVDVITSHLLLVLFIELQKLYVFILLIYAKQKLINFLKNYLLFEKKKISSFEHPLTGVRKDMCLHLETILQICSQL